MVIRKINLLPMLTSHKDFLLNAYNQKSIVETGFITYDYPMSDKRIDALLNSWLSDSDYYKCFVLEKDGDLIGTAQITNINYINRTCEIGIFLIEEFQGRGAALSAGLQLLEIVFDQMDFYKVLVRAQDLNKVIMKGAIKVGFTHEGTLKNFVRYKNGRTHLHFYGLSQQEYKNYDYSALKKYVSHE